MDKIKGTYVTNYKVKPEVITYISEFGSYQALLDQVDNKLGKTWEHKTFGAFLREFEQQVKGNEKDILPVLYDFGYLASAGYFVAGKTNNNEVVSADLIETYDSDFVYYGIKFATHKPGTDLRKILTDFSKDEKYAKGFQNDNGYRTMSNLGSLIDKNIISSVSADNYHSGGLKIRGNDPLITQIYNNLLAQLPAEK